MLIGHGWEVFDIGIIFNRKRPEAGGHDKTNFIIRHLENHLNDILLYITLLSDILTIKHGLYMVKFVDRDRDLMRAHEY